MIAAPDEARAMGERGRAVVSADFDRRKQAADFERLLLELVPESATGGAWAARAAEA